LAVSGVVGPLKAEVLERQKSFIGVQKDIAALAPVASAGAAFGDEALPAEGHAPVAAFA
jgi:hypothetical protein